MFLSSMFTNLLLLAAACTAQAKILYAGVNESGGEFGVYSSVDTPGYGLPGTFGVDYAFINKSTVDIFVDDEKINFFRVTFLMERMCPLSYGLGSRFNETYFSEYADAINYITLTKGAYALIDPHNYMRYNDPSQQPMSGSVIGNISDPKAATTEQFAEFWGELAGRFRSNPNVIFGINNEPHDMATNDQAAIDAIRAYGANQLILAPGNGWTGGHSWTQVTGANDAPSSEYMNKLVDPIHNLALDIHEVMICYLRSREDSAYALRTPDEDYSGTHANCTQPAPSNLANLTLWLQENNLKAVISEFGGGDNEGCYQMLDEMLKYMEDNDVYIGWSIWAAGPIWGTSSPCCGADTGSLEPGQFNDLGQPEYVSIQTKRSTLFKFRVSAYYSVWAQAVRPNIPKNLKRSGISSLS
ncbi:hypothetical protein H0H92_008448 [Tricholoma furcatifolium]|nr:hypothetical protein H0H92_008448 [Tricholoma furcatifolium]